MDKTTGIMGHDVAATETHIAFHSATESKPSHLEPDSLLIPWALSRRQSGLRVFWQEDAPKPPVMNSRRRAALVAKRGLDIVGALIGLLVLAPLLAITAICVKLTDRGPVFFRQTRVGREGKAFEILKFRSMHWDRCDISGVAQTVAKDHRVTPIGSFIRRTSIDELPQLINVLTGDMSLVGPRPHVRGMLAAGIPYEKLVPQYDFRHEMRPGLTGWAQCNGLRGPTVDPNKALQRVGHDFAYIQNFSLWLDAKILLKTIATELLSSTAH